MSELKKQLLIGCGYALRGGITADQKYRKRMRALGGTDRWDQLTTLDVNVFCDPDLLCDLNGHTPWVAAPRAVQWEVFHELESDYWDEIHAYEVLEHLGRQGDAAAFFGHFSEIWRLLKPNGYLLATVPSKRSGWFWGDPSHSRGILQESLVFLDQSEYIRQCDAPEPTPMSDFRHIYKADFKITESVDNGVSHLFTLQAVKPSRWRARPA